MRRCCPFIFSLALSIRRCVQDFHFSREINRDQSLDACIFGGPGKRYRPQHSTEGQRRSVEAKKSPGTKTKADFFFLFVFSKCICLGSELRQRRGRRAIHEAYRDRSVFRLARADILNGERTTTVP
ncbi:hypothetical protein BDW67DRAFT_160174 [Aspergillus spinulosporus]